MHQPVPNLFDHFTNFTTYSFRPLTKEDVTAVTLSAKPLGDMGKITSNNIVRGNHNAINKFPLHSRWTQRTHEIPPVILQRCSLVLTSVFVSQKFITTKRQRPCRIASTHCTAKCYDRDSHSKNN